jgi:hypothetical protein
MVRYWMWICFGLCGISGVSGVSGVSDLRAAEDSAILRQEVQAMREAYESRISALEGQLQQIKSSGNVPRSKSVGERIDESLDKKIATEKSSSVALLPVENLHAVQSSTQITLGGYTEFSYVNRSSEIAEFDQNRTVAELSARIHDKIKLYIELEFEHGAVITDGEKTGGELELEQAYVDYEINKALNFRAGMMLVPVGHFNLYHEGQLNNFVDRPLVNRRIMPTTWSEEGMGFHGTPLDSDWLGISYEAYMFNPASADAVSSKSGFRGIRREGTAPTQNQRAGAARVAFEPARKGKVFADFLEVGVSGYVSGFTGFKGENEDGDTLNLHDGLLNITALDATYEKWGFGARGEVAFAHVDSGANDTQRKQDGWGYYVEGFYKFWPKFLNSSPLGKGFKDPKLVFASRYDWVDLNRDSFDQRDMGRVTVGLSYRPVPHTVFKFDYQIDHSPSSRDGTTLGESGKGQNSNAFLFGVSTGF